MKFAVAGCAIACLLAAPTGAAPAGESGPCATATSTARLAAPGEPGEPLTVSGQVMKPDGVTPAAGVILYVYQTGADGLYNHGGGPMRLHAWLRTDAEGRYEYRTIRPAPYPGQTIPAHIHTQLWGGGAPPQYNRDMNFDDDKLLGDDERRRSESLGRFAFVRPLVRGTDGVWRATHDLRLKSEGDRFEPVIRHGLEPCGVRPGNDRP